MFKIDILGLYDKLSHENEEKDKTIHELQTVLKFRTNENKSLYKEINRLRKVIEIKDADRIELCKQVERYAKDIDNAELIGNEYSVERSREYAIKHLKESIENMSDLLKDLEESEDNKHDDNN